MVLRASKGICEIHGKALRDLVFKLRDIWRVRLSAEGPAKFTPLKVHLKPGAVPRRAKARRYAPKHLNFMSKHIKMLEEMGYIRRNPHSRWSSPVLIVEKPQLPNDFSVTVDTRYP